MDLGPLKPVILACYVWASYCMLDKHWLHSEYTDPLISGFTNYPIQLLCYALIVDNFRLFSGAAFGKYGASEFLGHLGYFLHMMSIPILFAALAAMLGVLTSMPWLRFVGGSAAVFFGMNSLNAYVSRVHGKLEYRDSYGISQYKRTNKVKDGEEPQTMLLPPLITVGLSVMTTFVVMATKGDILSFILQILTVLGQAALPSYKENRQLLHNLLQILATASLIRVERHL